MQLQELFLNRFLFRDNEDINANSSLASNYSNPGSGGSGGGDTAPALAIAPGTIIQSCLIQSSGSDDRIEINPDDTFRAYTDGVITTLIDSNGIVTENLTTVNSTTLFETVGELTVSDIFIYQGARQPINYVGVVSSIGVFIFSPPGWSVVRNSVGNYTITHNMAVPIFDDYVVTVSAINGHFRSRVPSRSANTFDVTWQQSAYSGGGLYTGEVSVDVSFYLAVSRYVSP